MPTSLPELDKEHWKYSNINAALGKLSIEPQAPLWEMSGAYSFLKVDALPRTADVHLVIPRGRTVDLPIELMLSGKDGGETHSLIRIDVEEGASATIIDRQGGIGAYWKNISAEIKVAANASLRYFRLCEDDPFCVTSMFTTVDLARDARFQALIINGCSGFGRHEFTVNLNGTNGEADLSGLSLLRGKQHADTTVCINHRAAHCRSSQFFKTILDGQSRGVYQGKIHVFKDAQKTDGYQLSRNLLLSRLAEMDVKPELEIYADDVKCSHGSATGDLDETPMFYLMSRGIPEADARRMLISAFADEVLDKIQSENIRKLFEERVKLWLI